MGEVERLEIGTIVLEWSAWFAWDDLALDNRGGAGVVIPNKRPGVYEVCRHGAPNELLHIGRATDLRFRIRQGLVKGIAKHSTRKRMAAVEVLAELDVRWAETDKPNAAEEALHQRHVAEFGGLPLYTLRT